MRNEIWKRPTDYHKDIRREPTTLELPYSRIGFGQPSDATWRFHFCIWITFTAKLYLLYGTSPMMFWATVVPFLSTSMSGT